MRYWLDNASRQGQQTHKVDKETIIKFYGVCRKPNNKVEAKLKSKYYGNKNRKKVHHL